MGRMEEYASKVAEPGFYLGVLDAVLFGEVVAPNNPIAMMVYGPGELSFGMAGEHIASLLPDGMCLDSTTGPRSPGDWGLLSVHTSYNPHEPDPNHWLPVFFKDSLSASDWLMITTVQQGRVAVQIATAKQSISDLRKHKDDDAAAQVLSLKEEAEQCPAGTNWLKGFYVVYFVLKFVNSFV